MISKNGVGLTILLIELLLSSLGIEFEAGSVARVVEGGLVVLSFLLMVWNQLTRRDVTGFLFKKV